MNYQNIIFKDENGIAIITINRPDKLNALNYNTIQEIGMALNEIKKNKHFKGVIITGSGEKAFIAGADISEFAQYNSDEAEKLSRDGNIVFDTLEKFHLPTIACVNGFALGGGCETAMSCHLRICTPNAKFGQPEVNLGIIPGYGGTQRLIQLIGKGKALELLMTADMIGAEEALKLGLVNYIESHENIIAKAIEIIEKIATKGPNAVSKIITCVHAYFQDGTNGFEKEIQLFGSCAGTEEFLEGTSAFLQKRKANFQR
jgi:enoyl-CoA hydratase